MKGKISYLICCLILTVLTSVTSFAQTGEQKVLEAKRKRLQEEIKEIKPSAVRRAQRKGYSVGPNGGLGQ